MRRARYAARGARRLRRRKTTSAVGFRSQASGRVTEPSCVRLAPRAASLDHLVGAQENRRRDREFERLRGPEVYCQLEFRGLLDR